MDIAHIMQRLEASNQASNAGIKTAAHQPQKTTAPASDALRNELRQALAAATTTKTAAAQSPAFQAPIDGLIKMAADLVDAEEEALMKQAQVYGAAICDGFMSRYAQYENAANQVVPASTKVAQTEMVDQDFQKFAAANPELTKEAYDLGYQTKIAQLRKEADEHFTAGYNDTMQEVQKVASDLYKHGTEWAQWAVRTAENTVS
jgi:hypothetical protein